MKVRRLPPWLRAFRTARRAVLGAAALALLALATGCTANGQSQACDPVPGGAACKKSQRCYVGSDGEPACTATKATKALGDLCTVPEECPTGSGCLSIDGRSSCAPFCDPATPEGAAACAEWNPAARCVASLPSHPEIGLCVVPCLDPGDLGNACPGAASACYVPAGLDMAVCSGVPGDAVAGAPCGPHLRCAGLTSGGLLCTPFGLSGRCRAVGPCGGDTFERPMPGAPRYTTCEPCRVVAGPFPGEAESIRYFVCAADSAVADAVAPCVALGGKLVKPVSRDAASALARAAANLTDGDVLFGPEKDFTGDAADCCADGTLPAVCGPSRTALCDVHCRTTTDGVLDVPCTTGHAVCRVDTAVAP